MPAVWRRAVQNERGAEMQEMLISLAVALIAGLLMSRLAKPVSYTHLTLPTIRLV